MEMGWKLKKKEFCLEPNEELDVCLTLVPENRAAIHGVVKFPNGRPVKDAIVKLFIKKDDDCKKGDDCDLIPVTFTFTDECGQFLFGVKSGVKYLVKVFFYVPEKKAGDKDSKCDCE